MHRPTAETNAVREQLKQKRNQLFEKLSENPLNTRLAIEIKLLDDRVADLTAGPADLSNQTADKSHYTVSETSEPEVLRF